MQALNKPNVVAIRPAVRPQRVMRLVVVNATTSNDIRNGMTIEIDGAPWRVTEFLHVKPGKGAAFVRTKLKVGCLTSQMHSHNENC